MCGKIENMKFTLSFFVVLLGISTMSGQNTFDADFERFETSPYFFRFGNNSSTTWYPRWKYSHTISPNPLTSNRNNSSFVLRYSSLEARWYGLKIKFPAPLNIGDIDTLSFDIYQPESIVGKAVNPNYNSAQPAQNQQILVKLLSYFNTIRDNREDAGVRLNAAIVDFTTTGEWVNIRMSIKPESFNASEREALSKGVLGIAIMPAYNLPGVTLMNEHVVYIDNIRIRPEIPTKSHSEELSRFIASWKDNILTVESVLPGRATLKIFTSQGSLALRVFDGELDAGVHRFGANLPAGVYFVSLFSNNRYYNQKLIVQ